MHRGHAYSAILAHDAARAARGRFLLRLEDIDAGRCRPDFATAILEDLAWLGLTWDEAPLVQSTRFEAYQTALASLRARGLLYRCFRTRAEVIAAIGGAPHGPQPGTVSEPRQADEEARLLAEGRPYAWRLSIGASERLLGGFSGLSFTDANRGGVAADPWLTGDVVLARKDLGVAYHLAVVVDDAFQGVTEVVRGEDLFEACHVQRLLQALLQLPTPAYRHHRLVLGADGKRLAKRDRGETLHALRNRGFTPADLRAQLFS